MTQVTQTYSDVSIGLANGSYEELLTGSEYLPSPDTFRFLAEIPISNSTDICAYLCAGYSLDYWDHKWEKKIIPPIYLFYRGEFSFSEMFTEIDRIFHDNDCEDGKVSEIIEELRNICSDDSDPDDLKDEVMEMISDVLGDPLFDEDLTEEICVPEPPITASNIACVFFYYKDFCQRHYIDWYSDEDYREFEKDSETSPDTPHFKYLLTKWAVFSIENDPAHGYLIDSQDEYSSYEDALHSGYIENLLPEWWFTAREETYYINHQTPDKPVSYEFPSGEKIISAKFKNQFEKLEVITIPETAEKIDEHTFENARLKEVFIPDGVKEIGDFAFSNNNSLKSVRLPNTLVRIGDKAFDNYFSVPKLEIPDSVTEIGFTERQDILQFAYEHGIHIHINTNHFNMYDIYKCLKDQIERSDAVMIRLLINVIDIPDEFMEFWHIGIMHDAIEFGTAEQTAILLNSGKLKFTNEELEYLIDYAAESEKTELTACLLNYKNEKN